MAFAPQFLDDIRARVRLADVIGKRTKLIRRGREYVALCPFHNEKTPSFTINEDKGFFHCFGCGAHGDVIGFVMQTEGLAFPEAVERLAGQAGLPMPVAAPADKAQVQRQDRLLAVNEAAAAWFEHRLRLPEGRAALDYLKERGLGDEAIARFRVGFAPDGRQALRGALERDGYSLDIIVEAGLAIRPDDNRAPYDRFRRRIIFPITDRRGRVIAFGGRLMGEGQPKYLNSPDTPLFHKGRVLYNLAGASRAARKGDELVVTEGYMDVIALDQAGFRAAVAPLGTALTEFHLEDLWRVAAEPILCLDGDEAGRRAATRAAERALPLLAAGRSLRFATLPEGEDPDSLIRGAGARAMSEVLGRARPLVDVVWWMETAGRPADTPERKASIRKGLRARVARIADREVQTDYLGEFDARLARAFGDRHAGTLPSRSPERGRARAGGRTAHEIGLKSDGNVRILALRQQQALVAAMVTHPTMVEDYGEEFGAMPLPAGDLDELRRQILKCWNSALDTGAMQSHLREHGFSRVLDRILSRDVYALAPFAEPGADLATAREGWRHLYLLYHRRRQFDREIKAAQEALAADTSDRAWSYLSTLKSAALADEDESEAVDKAGAGTDP